MVSPRNIRPGVALLVVLSAVWAVLAVFHKGSPKAVPESAPGQLPQNVDISLNNVRFVDTQGGVPVWEMLAEHVVYDKRGDVASLKGVRMVFAKKRGNGTITVTADSGRYANSEKNVLLTGNVHIVTDSGMTFDTPSLEYDAATSRFLARERVRVSSQRLTLAATGMEFDVTTEKSYFPEAVEASVDRMY